MPIAAHSPFDIVAPRSVSASSEDDMLNFDHWLMPPVERDQRERLVNHVSRLAGPVAFLAAVVGLSTVLL